MENRDYLIEEKPLKALLILALPMIAGNIFQQFYTMADSAIVGRFVSSSALAAVGASYALTNIFICVAIGFPLRATVGIGTVITAFFMGPVIAFFRSL